MATTEARPTGDAEADKAALVELEAAFNRRQKASPEAVRQMYASAAEACLRLGMSALEQRSLVELEGVTKSYIRWLERAQEDGQVPTLQKAVSKLKRSLSTREQRDVLSDFLMNVRLASIKDPFERWDAIAEEINKVWPKDLDAVEAIRRQRR